MNRFAFFISFVGLAWSGATWGQSGLFVTTTDFQTGSTAFVAAGGEEAEVNLLNIHGDAVARFYDGRTYVINRLGQDNILVLDEDDLRAPLLQFSVGNGSNPHDMVFVGPDKAYVSRYDTTSLLIVDPRDGSRLGEIDLSAFADGDGLPEMAQMALVGERLYVTCHLLDRDNGWVPASRGLLVVIDTATDQFVDMDPAADGVQAWPLATGNPIDLVARGDLLVVAQTASFGDREGGIEVIDLAAGSSRGLVISEADLGGDLTGLALASSSRGYAVISDDSFANHVLAVDLQSGAVSAPLEGHSGGFTPSIVIDGNRLVVADQGSFDKPESAGLLIYDTATDALLAGPITTGLPPSSIAVMSDVITAILEEESQALPVSAVLDAAYPNPFNAVTRIPFAVADSRQWIELAVYDLLGRKVHTLHQGSLAAGRYVAVWDGRDAAGRAVGNGAYFVELRLGIQRLARKIMLLK